MLIYWWENLVVFNLLHLCERVFYLQLHHCVVFFVFFATIYFIFNLVCNVRLINNSYPDYGELLHKLSDFVTFNRVCYYFETSSVIKQSTCLNGGRDL